jgi:hypothetical protein
MTMRRGRSLKRRKAAEKAPRRPALPLVQADSWLSGAHAGLIAEGFVLDKYVTVRIRRPSLMAHVTITWRKTEVEGRIKTLVGHEVIIDLRKYAR